MRTKPFVTLLLVLVGFPLVAALAYQLPPVKSRLEWRIDFALAYLRGAANPVGEVPTPLPQPTESQAPTATPAPATTATPEPSQPTATLSPSPTPLPAAASLNPPAWEKQGPNNCGPATLAMLLRYYGWEGDQDLIDDLIKPETKDRNVNVEEIVYYVRNRAGWLRAEFRVGGDLQTLKSLLAAGFPVMIEESFYDDVAYWPNDDLWAAHYLLVTGYDDASQTFIGQDSYRGPDRQIPYQTLDEYWKAFNRVYILVFRPEQEETLQSILGAQWDPDANRQHALEVAQRETEANPQDAFAWFNLGSNLVYFERYTEAGHAYDEARKIGLPQRFLRYQFGPFLAYFHGSRDADLLALAEYVLKNTPNSEEALLWRGWALYRKGDLAGARASFQAALQANRFYQDAQYALDFISSNP